MKNAHLTNSQTRLRVFLSIDEINECTITNYFTELNSGQFTTAANLFSENGQLKPPLEKLIQGRVAIAQYFHKESVGMRFYPELGKVLINDDNQIQYQIYGKVETSWFNVSILWLFQLNTAKEIIAVEVNLLASLTEFLSMSRN